MGKMKISNKKGKSATKGNSGIPNWLLTTIVVVVVSAVLLTCVATILTSTGAVKRAFNAMKSEDYKVNGNMMTYFYANTYTNFANTYSSYMKMFSIGENSSISDHRNIIIGGTESSPNTYDTMYFSAYEGKSWFDYFMDQTLSSVKSMLIYCEEADALNITLTKDEEKSIEDSIDASIMQFKIYALASGGDSSISDSTCLSAMYGEGVNRSDVRKAMRLSTLAAKCAQQIEETLDKAITDDRINKEYSDNVLDYDAIDYFYYTYSVSYEDVVKEVAGKDATDSEKEAKKTEIIEAYKKKIEEAKQKAAALAECKTLEEFKKYVFDNKVGDNYKELFDAKGIKDADKPKEEALKTIKDKITAAVVAEVLEGKTETADDVKESKSGEGDNATTTYTLYDISINEAFAKAIRSIREDLFKGISNINTSYEKKRGSYSEKDDFMVWAFDDERKAGDVKAIKEGDGSAEGELKVDKEYYRETVYFLTKPQYKDEQNSRNVAYMLFSSTTDANKVIAALDKMVNEGTTITKDKFQSLATENGAVANTVAENYVYGNMQSTAFDAWIYGEDTKKGDYTKTALTMSDGSIMVAFYIDDGEPSWKVTVKNVILNEDFGAREDKMTVAHSGSIKTNDWVIGMIAK